MRRGRATTAIEGASDSGLKTPRPQFAPKVCKQLMRRLLSIPFARFHQQENRSKHGTQSLS